jgi:hypothetical protein
MEDPVDGDGCVSVMFAVLAQNVLNPRTGKPEPFSQCRVAASVSYAYQTKAFWYYTKPDDLQLRTKPKADLSNSSIIEGFVGDDLMMGHIAPENRSEIVAVYTRSFQQRARAAGEQDQCVTMIDYLDAATLKSFLYAPPHAKQNNGILQRFVPSKGEYNSVIRVVWTPRHVDVTRRVSRRPLVKGFVKKMHGVHRRVATFEGPPTLSRETVLTGTFPRPAVIESTEAVVDHLQSAGRTHNTVAAITLYFKVDPMDRVWLLWCGSMRLLHEGPGRVMQIAPPVLAELRLGVPMRERQSRYFGQLAASPGGREGAEIEVEQAVTARARGAEREADTSLRELQLTSMSAPFGGRHLPTSNVLYGQVSNHSISQLTLPWTRHHASGSTGGHGSSLGSQSAVQLTVGGRGGSDGERKLSDGEQRSQRADVWSDRAAPASAVLPSPSLGRALPAPAPEFSVGGIYRRQTRAARRRQHSHRHEADRRAAARRRQQQGRQAAGGGGGGGGRSSPASPNPFSMLRILPPTTSSSVRPLARSPSLRGSPGADDSAILEVVLPDAPSVGGSPRYQYSGLLAAAMLRSPVVDLAFGDGVDYVPTAGKHNPMAVSPMARATAQW